MFVNIPLIESPKISIISLTSELLIIGDLLSSPSNQINHSAKEKQKKNIFGFDQLVYIVVCMDIECDGLYLRDQQNTVQIDESTEKIECTRMIVKRIIVD